MNLNTIYCADVVRFLEDLLVKLGEKSIHLIMADSPYFQVVKEDWDWQWETVNHYLKWCKQWIQLSERLLKDNGNLILFHNVFPIITELHRVISEATNFRHQSFITWNKMFKRNNGVERKCKNYDYLKGYLVVENKHKLEQMCEYILIYNFDNTYKLERERIKKDIPQKTISKEILSKNDNLTGWYSNIEKGKNYPTLETIKPITKHLGLTYEEIVPKFNNQGTHHCVWNYELAEKILIKNVKKEEKPIHITPKPIKLIEDLLLHYSDEEDLVINLFSGSGNHEIACKNKKRNFIGCDFKKEYVDFANNRLKQLNLLDFTTFSKTKTV